MTWVCWSVLLLLVGLVSTSRRNNNNGRKGTLPLPGPIVSPGPAGGGYYDSEESKYALWGGQQQQAPQQGNNRVLNRNRNRRTSKKPNIVLLLADDQDIELGSMNFMPKTLQILGEGGAHFPNAYVTTPMCCPSRSSLLTGLYVHNHDVYTNNDNCSSLIWQQEHEPHTFATYLNNAGYRTAFFGKYLNEYNGSYIPPGWREWAGLVRNSRFYNYTINVNGNKIKHGADYASDYYPDLIANDSLAFLRRSKQYFVNKPVLMVLSFPTPHGPEDSAPQYQHLFHNVTTHRTPSWNFAPNPDKQWLLRHTQKMEPIHVQFTDILHTKRLQTLQSIDETVGKLYQELLDLGELDNTYIVYTSDHGYHLGQFGLVKGKSMPFEFDVRVPFYIRGPKVPQGVRINKIVLNVDLAPTFLDIGGVEVPDHMDGKSFLPIMTEAFNSSEARKKKIWRDSFLIERGKVNRDFSPNSMLSKEEKIAQECQLLEYKSPCQPYQKWECIYDGTRWRIHKCQWRRENCICNEGGQQQVSTATDELFEEVSSKSSNSAKGTHHKVDPLERRLQRRFLKEHLGKDFKPVFLGAKANRHRRHLDFDVDGVYRINKLLTLLVDQKMNSSSSFSLDYDNLDSSDEDFDLDIQNEQMQLDQQDEDDILNQHRIVAAQSRTVRSRPVFENNYNYRINEGIVMAGGCIMWANSSISCPEDVYRDPRLWREKKERLDTLIKKLQHKLGELKGIRKHLKRKRPHYGQSSNVLTDPVTSSQNSECLCDDNQDDDDEEDAHSHQQRRLREERQKVKEERLKKKERKMRRKAKLENLSCNVEKMNCFSHSNEHWKTPPIWTEGPFCFCQNSNNNTYWCLRTINETHNFLYCEFITGFITFYDLKIDPYQLRNAIYDLDFVRLEEMRKTLNKLRSCKGGKECNTRYKPEIKRDKLKNEPSSSLHNFRHWQRRRRRVHHQEERRG